MSKPRKKCFRLATLGMNVDEACSYAIETIDNAREMRRALAILDRRYFNQSELIRIRLAVHAQTVGFDNSEEIVKGL